MNNDHPDHDLTDPGDANDQEDNTSREVQPLTIEDADLVDFEIGIRIDEALIPPALADSDAEETPASQDGADAIYPSTGPDVGETAAATEVFPSDRSEQPLVEAFPPASLPEEAPPAPGPDSFETIHLRLEELVQAFDAKLKYDAHKNKIIDDLHLSLQQHRDGLLKKYLHRIVMDVIKIVDDMRKLTAHYNQQLHSEETSTKLLKYIENIASDLEDLFSWEGVTPFTCDGNTVDPSRQRILGKIQTDDPEKDKTVAERLRPGYEWDGKIIRPEMISVYVYQPNSPLEE